MALTQIEQGMLKDGILTADTAGRLKMADGFVNDAKIAAMAAGKLTGSRTLPTGVVPAGTVLQVVNVVSNVQVSTNSASLSYSGFSASITPLYSTSKILVIYSNGGAESNQNSGAQCQIKIYRDAGATLVFNMSISAMYSTYGSLGPAATKLDSPATTSQVTYQIWYASNGANTFYMSTNGSGQSFTLMEIAG